MGGLDLRTLDSLMTGGKSGPAVTPGHPEKSLLWKMVHTGKMPMGGDPLPTEEKDLIRLWIERGQFPSKGFVTPRLNVPQISEKDRRFWSFQPPVKHAVPGVRHADRVRTPIDAFILEKLEATGWTLNPDAAPRTLVRRAYFDLVGLPPPSEVVEAFVEDPSDEAYARLVDRLLASPQYGERWGRHWLDVAGFVESTGGPGDEPRPESWRYRDYVIRAFNQDKPYDQFLVEQFAGDQLVNYRGAAPDAIHSIFAGMVTEVVPERKPLPEVIEKLVATGFLRLAPDASDNQTMDQVDKWYDALQAATEIPIKAVMGLQLACARCHDHKFDPIPQDDYYKFVAIFQPAYDPQKWIAANLKFGPWPARYVHNASEEEIEAYACTIRDLFPEFRSAQGKLSEAYKQYRKKWREQQGLGSPGSISKGASSRVGGQGDDPEITDEELEAIFPELAEQARHVQQLEKEIEKVTPERIFALWDVSRGPSETRLLVRGDYKTPGRVIEPGILSIFDDPEDPFEFPEPDPSWNHTGRRLALARWLTQPDHPLTSRVFVNRVWQYHFGQGVVRTPDDFGSQGARPTHPELLDWLAVSFVEHGWSVKWLHSQMMLSSVYRQSSEATEEKLAADPSNKLLWRKTPVRLEAEVIRDAMLSVSGELGLAMYGRSVPLTEAADGQTTVDASEQEDHRRSIYLLTKRTQVMSFLQAFDAPIVQSNVPIRFQSAIPQQSLGLMNNPFTIRAAASFAERVRTDEDPVQGIRRAFQLAFSRDPNEAEVSLAYGLIQGERDKAGAWRTFCQAVLASNEFLYAF